MKLICFDLDGTLIDSRKDIIRAVNGAMNYLGLGPVSLEEGLQYIGKGAKFLLENVLPESSKGDVEEAEKRFLYSYHKKPVVETTVYPGVQEFLNSNFNKYNFIVITNKDEQMAEKILDELGLLQFFKQVIGASTYPVIKPDPLALNEAMGKFKATKENTLMVGDTNVDIQFGKNAGVKTCRYLNDFGALKNEAVLEADFNINSFDELSGVIDTI